MVRTVTHGDRSDDRELVTALRGGDETAFVALVDAWSGWMLRLAREHVPNHASAEDVVQETWLAVLKGLDGYRGDAALRTWVYRILLNQAKRRGVNERRVVPFASLQPEDDGPTVDPSRFRGADDAYPGHWREFPDAWPDRVALTREVHAVVVAALDDLPPRQRTVVVMRDLEDRPADEVCTMLGITAGNQRVLLHRGRAVVRAHLERYFDDRPATPSGVIR